MGTECNMPLLHASSQVRLFPAVLGQALDLSVTWVSVCYSQVHIAIFFQHASLQIAGGGKHRDQQIFHDSTIQHKLTSLQQAPSSRAGCAIWGHSHHRVSVTHLSEVSATCIHPLAKRLIMKALPKSASSKDKLPSSNHLFKLALFILSSNNYQWLCLSLASLFHCDLETTRSISNVLLSFLNTICNFSYPLPHPPCLQAPPPLLAHKHRYIFSLLYSPAIPIQQHSKPENTLVKQASNIDLTSPLPSRELLSRNSHETLLGRKEGKTLTANSFPRVFSVCPQGMTSPCLKVAP